MPSRAQYDDSMRDAMQQRVSINYIYEWISVRARKWILVVVNLNWYDCGTLDHIAATKDTPPWGFSARFLRRHLYSAQKKAIVNLADLT